MATVDRITDQFGIEYVVRSTKFADSANLDAFGLLRTTGKPGNRFDVEFIYDKQPELVDEVTAGSGSATHNTNSRDITLAVGDATTGSAAGLYGFDVPYTPGSSQLIEITGTLDGAGLGTGEAELFVRSKITGSVVEATYSQSAWSADTADTVDWSKSQIFAMDFQSLRVGRIRFALNRSGEAVKVHEVANKHPKPKDLGFPWRYAPDAEGVNGVSEKVDGL